MVCLEEEQDRDSDGQADWRATTLMGIREAQAVGDAR